MKEIRNGIYFGHDFINFGHLMANSSAHGKFVVWNVLTTTVACAIVLVMVLSGK